MVSPPPPEPRQPIKEPEQTPVPVVREPIPELPKKQVEVPRQPKSAPSPIPEVQPKPEAKKPEVEEKTSKPEEVSSKIDKPEEKTSTSGKTKKLKVYNGEGGRIHTEKQIEEILDWYLQTGELPDYVSERQRWSYKHHRTLLERRKLLEQRGITIVIHEIGGHKTNVIPISGSSKKRGKRASN